MSQIIFLSKLEDNSLNNISAISTDCSGFIWLATQSGTSRFDGKTNLKITFGKSKGNLQNYGSSSKLIYNNNSKQLLAYYSKYGIAALNRTSNSYFFQQVPIFGLDVNLPLLFIDHMDQQYIIANAESVYFFELNKNAILDLYKAELDQKISEKDIYGVCKINNNTVAIISGINTLTTYKKNNSGLFIKTTQFILDLPENIKEIYSLNYYDKNYFVGTSKGLFQFSDTENAIKLTRKYIAQQAVYFTYKMYDSSIYVAGSNGLYLLDRNNNLNEIIDNNNSNTNSYLSTVYGIVADSNKVWLATQSGVAIFDHNGTPFSTVTGSENSAFKPNQVYQINADANGDIIISSENGLYKYRKNFGINVEQKNNTFFLSVIAPDSSCIVSTINNTYFKNGNRLISIEKKFPEFNGFQHLSFNDFEYLNNGKIILGTENELGIYIWDYKNKSINRLETTLRQPEIIKQSNNLYKDSDIIYILTDLDFWEYSGNKLKSHRLVNKEKTYGLLFDMLRLGNKYFFTSYDNGVIVTDMNFNIVKIYSTDNGLSDNGVYKIHSLGDSVLLVSSNNGINAIILKTDIIKVFTTEEGLHNNLFEEFSSFENDGKIYFGGKNGFTIVDKVKLDLALNKNNNLQFIECKVIDNRNLLNNFVLTDITQLTIPNTTTQTTITFSNLIYPYKTKIKYAYRISGLHQTWIDLGSNAFVTLTGIPPGTYHLQVKAANEDGVWSEPKELVLIFQPKWYQTLLFKLLVFLTTTGIIYAFYRYRISQIKKQHQIRKNIATDLHDDLGSTLNSVKVFTNLAISGVKQEESLQQVKDNLTEATMSLRDMIWVLDDSLDTVDELITRLKQFAIPVAAASNIEAIIKADSDVNSRQLTKEEKRNLFLICKEAINNSIKYSGASRIDISIIASGKKIQISIADNGKGFNVDEVKKGYGLKNMQYRASQIKYQVTLTSSDNGTQINIHPI